MIEFSKYDDKEQIMQLLTNYCKVNNISIKKILSIAYDYIDDYNIPYFIKQIIGFNQESNNEED